MAPRSLSILVPVFNEERVIPLFFERIQPVINQLSGEYTVNLVFLNNASTDGTQRVVEDLCRRHENTFLITLSKNVGYQRSLECGLRNTPGDLFAFIDVDCEDPPEMLLEFVAAQQRGYDVVYGERVDREEPESIKRMRKIFYRLTRAIADEEIILDMAEFSLLTAEVRDAIIQDRTSFPFIRASIGRVGFRRLGIPYKRHKRIAGETHYNFWGMTKFAVAGILSSTTMFLRLPLYTFPLWLLVMCGLCFQAATTDARWAMPVFLMTAFAYFGFTLSFIALYIARIYKDNLGRPNAVISREFSILPDSVLPNRNLSNTAAQTSARPALQVYASTT